MEEDTDKEVDFDEYIKLLYMSDRFMDDMILFHRDKSYLQYSLSQIKEKCEH